MFHLCPCESVLQRTSYLRVSLSQQSGQCLICLEVDRLQCQPYHAQQPFESLHGTAVNSVPTLLCSRYSKSSDQSGSRRAARDRRRVNRHARSSRGALREVLASLLELAIASLEPLLRVCANARPQ